MKIEWKQPARKKFLDFLQLLAEVNPAVQHRWYTLIEETTAKLSNFPLLGKKTLLNYRELVIKPFRIFYRIDTRRDTIVIVAFYHSRESINLS